MVKSDNYWVARAIKGSQEAYARLVAAYQRPLFSVIVRMVRDPALAEDLTQESFVKAFRALESFDTSRKFSSWLFTIAHNTTIDHVRRRQVSTVPLDGSNREDDDRGLAHLAVATDASPEEDMAHRELAGDLETALTRLRPEYAEVLVLRFQQDLSYEEIAEITCLPLGTVKTHLYRARKALAEALEKRGWDPSTGGVTRR
ncbi:MAG: sigma-70 family RNA polymerase sigma factor [Thermoanaerobaculia bacterium]